MATPGRLVSGLACALLALLALGCDLEIDVKNAAPRVTWVAATPAAAGVSDLTVWISDKDGDPVDLRVSWERDGVDQGDIDLASGGHGLSGLTTREARLDANGQPHLIRWLVDGIATSASVRLVLAPADSEAGDGQVVVSQAFTLAAGLVEATPVEAASGD